ncbi:hypothetical protein P350_01330 [Burkholderia cepacia JBK9]|nr:hypothetical protein P350_01330 [Burkholderia cepacia JBK9]
MVWLFDPWTGKRRERMEIERDEEGRLLALSREDPSLLLWDSLFAKVHGAHCAMLGLEQAGWTCDLDYDAYVVTAARGALKLAFRLKEPAEEERLYILLHDETLLRVVIR